MKFCDDEHRLFTIKKSVLVAFCVIDIVIYIIYASAAKHFAEKFLEEHNKTMEGVAEDPEEQLKTTTRLIVIGSLLGISLQVVGLVGALRHNLYLSSAYSIAMTVGAIIAIVRSHGNFSRYWLNTLWSFTIAVCSLFFLWDLYYRAQVKRLKARRNKHVIEIDMANIDENGKEKDADEEEKISFIENDKDLFK